MIPHCPAHIACEMVLTEMTAKRKRKLFFRCTVAGCHYVKAAHQGRVIHECPQCGAVPEHTAVWQLGSGDYRCHRCRTKYQRAYHAQRTYKVYTSPAQ